jgi:hypothetical protein
MIFFIVVRTQHLAAFSRFVMLILNGLATEK